MYVARHKLERIAICHAQCLLMCLARHKLERVAMCHGVVDQAVTMARGPAG